MLTNILIIIGSVLLTSILLIVIFKIWVKKFVSKNIDGWTNEKNQRQCELIDKEIYGLLTNDEQIELEMLQDEMLVYRREITPLFLDELRKLRQILEENK